MMAFVEKNILVMDDPEQQAGRFIRVRRAHQSETAEDYVELIADLISIQGEARISDLAERLGVTHATVHKTVARLNRDGFVVNKPYRSLFLTDDGRRLAQDCKARHGLIVDFLVKIGLPRIIAEADAEGIEHHVSQETLDAFKRIVTGHNR